MTTKAAYVASQGQTREHECHWPGCTKQVPPAMWGCKEHWFQLPIAIRDRIWRAFVPGQEVSMMPSRAYMDAANEAQRWIQATFAGVDDKHDPGRWERLKRWVADRDAKRFGKRQSFAAAAKAEPRVVEQLTLKIGGDS